MSNLSRVNLLVGKNDCGKTSILEAIHFLVSRGDPEVLARCAELRGEGTDVAPRSAAPSLAEAGSRPRQTGPSIARFFFGHCLGPDEAFRISGEGRGCVSIHKIGRSIRKAVHLDAARMQVAVEQNIEVR